jgi:hypothetical protein
MYYKSVINVAIRTCVLIRIEEALRKVVKTQNLFINAGLILPLMSIFSTNTR